MITREQYNMAEEQWRNLWHICNNLYEQLAFVNSAIKDISSQKRRGLSMTIERLPREYPIGSTVWTNKGYGTVLARLGKYHLIWLQRLA